MAEAIDERLLQIVERIERLIEERKGISDDIRDVYAEAKAVGYEPRLIRALIQRRAMPPDVRDERDMLLETYEAAIGMGSGEPVPTIAELRPDAAAMAASMLAADIVAMEDPEQASTLVDHVLFLLDLRAEIALLRQQEAARRALAKEEGFIVPQLAQVVRWFEKVAKHGLDAMKLGEATFQLYRGTVDAAQGREAAPVSGDAHLGALFQLPQRTPAKPRKIDATLARLRDEAAMARRALGEE